MDSSGVEVLSCSGCFITCMGAHFPTVELDNSIQIGTLSRIPGWGSCGNWFGRFLQYKSRLEILACSLDADLNYVTTMLQLRLYLNHWVTLRQILGEDAATFWVYSQRQMRRPSSALSWTQGPAEFPSKCVNSLDEIPKIPSWFSFGFGRFVLPLYIDSHGTCLILSFNIYINFWCI